MEPGLFITVEGVDGAGKSTQLEHLEHWIRNKGLDVITTREPGGTALGEYIRKLLVGENHITFDDDVELMLMFAARLQHLKEVIQPAIAAGKCIICDRFTDATYAYQGGGRGIKNNRIEVLENWVQGDFQPDLTLIFDLPVETGVTRTSKRGGKSDRFESQNIEFKQVVRQVYLSRAEAFPERVRLIDASGSIEQVTREMIDVVSIFLETRESVVNPQ